MKWISILLITLLTGCVTPTTRLDVDEFELINKGTVDTKSVLLFVDCLSDRFNAAHYLLTNIEVRQSQRAAGYRVETYTGTQNFLIISADIFNDGRVELYESSSAALINTKGEREAFNQCLKQYVVNANH